MSSTLPSSAALSSTTTGGTTRPVAAGSSVLRILARFVRALRHRAEVTRLLDMDERGLKDIGLSRSDVIGALDGPLAEDPSVRLRLDAVARRVRSRSLALSVRPLARNV